MFEALKQTYLGFGAGISYLKGIKGRGDHVSRKLVWYSVSSNYTPPAVSGQTCMGDCAGASHHNCRFSSQMVVSERGLFLPERIK